MFLKPVAWPEKIGKLYERTWSISKKGDHQTVFALSNQSSPCPACGDVLVTDVHRDLIVIVFWLFHYIPMYNGSQESLQWRHNGHDGVSNHQHGDCLLNRLFGRRSKKTSKLRVTGLCAGYSPGTGEFPAQMASNAENASIWWRHHVNMLKPEQDGRHIAIHSFKRFHVEKKTFFEISSKFLPNVSIDKLHVDIILFSALQFHTKWHVCIPWI